MNHLPIFERIKSWKTLRPGESLSLSASRKRLGDNLQDPGKYDFWAIYFPPAMEKDERKSAHCAGDSDCTGDGRFKPHNSQQRCTLKPR